MADCHSSLPSLKQKMNPRFPDSWMRQFVGGSDPRLPKYLKS
ncbi:MAG TPA: hypothetical protein VFC05_13300 [Nitrososphaeraceae archaeon]|nr:hypothetical protein [Nitrososphaeraceae archaeon]